jgi:hypothetical protein
LEKDEGAVRERYRRFPVRFFLISFLDFFVAAFFFGIAFTFRVRLVMVGLNSSSTANSSMPISEPVAATLAAFATSLTDSPSIPAIEARFFFAIFPASYIQKHNVMMTLY